MKGDWNEIKNFIKSLSILSIAKFRWLLNCCCILDKYLLLDVFLNPITFFWLLILLVSTFFWLNSDSIVYKSKYSAASSPFNIYFIDLWPLYWISGWCLVFKWSISFHLVVVFKLSYFIANVCMFLLEWGQFFSQAFIWYFQLIVVGLHGIIFRYHFIYVILSYFSTNVTFHCQLQCVFVVPFEVI